MNEQKIETRRFLKRSAVELLNSKIVVNTSTPFESNQFEVSYEQIEDKKSVSTKVNFGLLILTLFLSVTGILYLFGNSSYISLYFFIFAFVILLVAFLTKLKVISIKTYDGNVIDLYFTNHNKIKILEFAEQIIQSSNNYLLQKYSKIDKDLPIDEQIRNLSFLRNKELISEDKFEELKKQLLGKDNKYSIGYRNDK